MDDFYTIFTLTGEDIVKENLKKVIFGVVGVLGVVTLVRPLVKPAVQRVSAVRRRNRVWDRLGQKPALFVGSTFTPPSEKDKAA